MNATQASVIDEAHRNYAELVAVGAELQEVTAKMRELLSQLEAIEKAGQSG